MWASLPHQTWAVSAEEETEEGTWSLPSEGSGNLGSQDHRTEDKATLFSAQILESLDAEDVKIVAREDVLIVQHF